MTHRIMKMMASYVSAVYGLTPDGSGRRIVWNR